jgi:hypothetical protein
MLSRTPDSTLSWPAVFLIQLLACLAPLCVVAQPSAAVIGRPNIPPARSTVVNAKDFGAKGDGVTDDTVAIQNAIDFSFGPASAPNGTNYYLNYPLYFPAGHYIVKAPLMFTQLQGGRITGDGRFSTTIENRTGTGVIATNGCSYSYWDGIALTGTGSATIFDLNWDNSPGGDALQSNTFQDMSFSGGAIGVNIGADGFMGSENLFLNCKWTNHSIAGLKTSNYNALQNTIVGGNISSSALGVWMYSGTVSIYNVGFQQQTNWDIKQDNSANAAIVISGTRTESANFFYGTNGMNIKIEGVSQDTSAPGVFASVSGVVSIEACHSVNGQIMGAPIGSIQSSNFGRDDWLQSILTHTNLTLASVSLPSSYIDKATVTASGFSYPTQRMLIPIPANNGNGSVIVRAGTLVQKITLILETVGTSGTINVGDDSDGDRYFSDADLTLGTVGSIFTETYYAADSHILVACTGAKGAIGYVAVDYQHVAMLSAW